MEFMVYFNNAFKSFLKYKCKFVYTYSIILLLISIQFYRSPINSNAECNSGEY